MERAAKILKEHLLENKEAVLIKWFHLLLEAYPGEAVRHLKKSGNKFTNPLGSNIYQGLEGIYDEITQDTDEENLKTYLDKILRIQAIQDVSPSRAIAFIYVLKTLTRQEFAAEIKKGVISDQELFSLDSELDSLALIAFNIYTDCREKIYQLRIEELKKNYEILERANMLNDFDPNTFMKCSNYIENENQEK